MTIEMKAANNKFLIGTVHTQWVRCGKPNCHCVLGELHGPYFYRFWRDNGRLRKQYVPAAEVNEVQAACAARRDFEQWLRAESCQAIEQIQYQQVSIKEIESYVEEY